MVNDVWDKESFDEEFDPCTSIQVWMDMHPFVILERSASRSWSCDACDSTRERKNYVFLSGRRPDSERSLTEQIDGHRRKEKKLRRLRWHVEDRFSDVIWQTQNTKVQSSPAQATVQTSRFTRQHSRSVDVTHIGYFRYASIRQQFDASDIISRRKTTIERCHTVSSVDLSWCVVSRLYLKTRSAALQSLVIPHESTTLVLTSLDVGFASAPTDSLFCWRWNTKCLFRMSCVLTGSLRQSSSLTDTDVSKLGRRTLEASRVSIRP